MPHVPSWLVRKHRAERRERACVNGVADGIADVLTEKVATEDPASPHFEPAFGFAEPRPDVDVPGSVGSLLTKLLEHHRGEVERLSKEIDAIRHRADDAIASREAVRQHHQSALDIWGAAQDARIAAWTKDPEGSATVEPVEMPEAAE